MSHLGEKRLILALCGAGDDAAMAHLEACAACCADLDRLRRTLALVPVPAVPGRDDEYGARLWRRLRPLLPERPLPERATPRWRAWVGPRRLAWTGAAAALVLAGFLAGRLWQTERDRTLAGARPEAARERVLLLAVGSHLERSRMVLLEVLNADPGKAPDLGAEQALARELIGASRLYRQSALRGPDPAVHALLERLERALIEIANAPGPARLAEIQERIRSQGLLLRIRVLGSRMREGDRPAPRPAGPDAT